MRWVPVRQSPPRLEGAAVTCGGEPVRITQEQTNVCTCPLATGVIGAQYNVFVYPQDDCPIHAAAIRASETEEKP